MIYERYIAKNYFLSFVVTVLVLCGVVWLTRGLEFLSLIVNNGISIVDYLYVTLLILPPIFVLITPVASYVAAIFCYNRLYVTREINVLMSFGISKYKILRPVIIVSICITIINYGLSLYFLPIINHHFKQEIFDFRNNHISMIVQDGVFLHPIDNLTLYFSKKRGEVFEGVFIYDNRDKNNLAMISSETGKIESQNGRSYFYLSNGIRQNISTNDSVQILHFKNLRYDFDFKRKNHDSRGKTTGEMHISELLKGETHSKNRSIKMISEAHQRIIWPMLDIIMTLIGAITILAGDFLRKGKNKQIYYSSIRIIIIFILFTLLNNLTTYSIYSLYAEYALLLFLLIPLVKYCRKHQ